MEARLIRSHRSPRRSMRSMVARESRFDFHPSNAAFRIEHEDGGVGDAVFFLAGVGFVAKGVAVDDSRSGIGEQRERHRTAVIGREELREFSSLLGGIGTDRVDLHFGICAGEITKSGQLPGAVRSPIAAIENQHDLRPGRIRQADAFSVLIEEREERRRLADLWRRHLRRPNEDRRGAERGVTSGSRISRRTLSFRISNRRILFCRCSSLRACRTPVSLPLHRRPSCSTTTRLLILACRRNSNRSMRGFVRNTG